MKQKEVLLVLTDRWADWEASHAIAEVNSVPQYAVKTIAVDKKPKESIGGLRAEIDYVVKEYQNFNNIAMVILPGGFSWKENAYEEIVDFLTEVKNREIPIAAICGATIFLGKHGFLDTIKHTGDELECFLSEEGYNGKEKYVSAQIVVDGGFITANETAAVDFAYEIFKMLEIDEASELDEWHDNFKRGAVR